MINDAITFEFRRHDQSLLTLPTQAIGGVVSTFTKMAEELAALDGLQVRVGLELLSAQQGSLRTSWIATVEWLAERRTSVGEIATILSLPLAAFQTLGAGAAESQRPASYEPSYEEALSIVNRAESRKLAEEWVDSLRNAIEICKVDEVLIIVPDAPGRVLQATNHQSVRVSEILRVRPEQISRLVKDLRSIDVTCEVVVLDDRTVRYFTRPPDSDLNNFLMQLLDIQKSYSAEIIKDERTLRG